MTASMQNRPRTPESIAKGRELFDLCKATTPDMQKFYSLVASGAQLNEHDDTGNAMIWAALKGHHQIVKTLVELGVPLEHKDNSGVTALYWAVYGGHEKTLALLIAAGAEVDVSDSIGTTAVIAAVERHRPECLRLLLDARADIDYATDTGRTAMDTARLHHRQDMIDMLEEAAAKTAAERERVARMDRHMKAGLPLGQKTEGLPQINANRRKKGPAP